MSHPKRYDDNDPHYQRVRELALEFPGADMKVSHGVPAFFTKKIFAYYSGSQRFDKDDWVKHPHSIVVLPSDDAERAALLELDVGYHPAYLGPYGWVGYDVGDATDWDEVRELLEASYRRTAGKRLIAQLDEG